MKIILTALLAATLTGCATWSTSSVDSKSADTAVSTQAKKTPPSSVVITDKDIPDRKYQSLAGC